MLCQVIPTKWFFQLQTFTFSRITNISHHVELPPQPLKGCYQFCYLVNRGTMGVNSLPKTDTRHRRDCDLNPGPSAPESSTLTTRLPSQLKAGWITKYTKKAHTIKRTKMICRYGDFTVFEMAAVRQLGFVKFKFLTVGEVKRPILHQRTKFRKDRSNRCENIAIFVIFQDGCRRHLGFSKI